MAGLPPASWMRNQMLNQDTGFKVAVIVPPGDFPILEVPPTQVERVHQLLVEHGIGHTVGSQLMRDDPDAAVTIHLGRLSDRQQIQDVLDGVS
jgi:hypothetical protein